MLKLIKNIGCIGRTILIVFATLLVLSLGWLTYLWATDTSADETANTVAVEQNAEESDETDTGSDTDYSITLLNSSALTNVAENIIDWAKNLFASDDADEETAADLKAATVVRVVDGDTIVIELDGEEQYVRLIGIDAAESVHPDASRNTEEGEEASDHLKSILSAGDTVYLQTDTSDTDKYDRLLRYVWLEMPTDVSDISEIKTKMLNAILIIDGYADPARYEPDTAYADIFDSLVS